MFIMKRERKYLPLYAFLCFLTLSSLRDPFCTTVVRIHTQGCSTLRSVVTVYRSDLFRVTNYVFHNQNYLYNPALIEFDLSMGCSSLIPRFTFLLWFIQIVEDRGPRTTR